MKTFIAMASVSLYSKHSYDNFLLKTFDHKIMKKYLVQSIIILMRSTKTINTYLYLYTHIYIYKYICISHKCST